MWAISNEEVRRVTDVAIIIITISRAVFIEILMVSSDDLLNRKVKFSGVKFALKLIAFS